MRRTRFMTWFFLALSLTFFCMREFRVALETPLLFYLPSGWTGEYGSLESSRELYTGWGVQFSLPLRILEATGVAGRLDRRFTLERYASPDQFRRMTRTAEQQGDGEFPAFAALHLPLKGNEEEVFRLTELAVARDGNLGWLYFQVGLRILYGGQSAPFNEKLSIWADKLQSWDPDNATVYFFRALLLSSSRKENWPSRSSGLPNYLNGLAQEVEWQKAMAEVFARQKFDTYSDRRFESERKFLLRQGWNHPVVVASLLNSIPVPNILPVRDYANLLVMKFGAEAEKAGQVEKAFGFYRQVERFGESLRLPSHDLIQDLIGQAIQMTAIDRLSPALKKTGREGEAATLEFLLKQIKQNLGRDVRDQRALSDSFFWSWLTVMLCALLTWVFLILSLVPVLYVNAKLWIRRDKKGLIYRVFSVAENYFPILLLVACFGLYVSHAPFAHNFSYYMTTEGTYNPHLLLINARPVPDAFFWERPG